MAGQPNPFLFGSEPQAAEMANPFMDASQGMAEVNPFMAQQQMMGQQQNFNSFNQFGQPAPHADPANPFGGGFSSMGYQAPGMMNYGGIRPRTPTTTPTTSTVQWPT